MGMIIHVYLRYISVSFFLFIFPQSLLFSQFKNLKTTKFLPSCFPSKNLQDGHVEVARLLLDSGAQVNMPADSFESPLTLAACGGHVELAALLIERGANLEEVNDEGYTPLMEAAREGHEEMVALLLAQGKVVLLL